MIFKLKPLGKTTAPKPKNPGSRKYNPSLGAQNTSEGKVFSDRMRAATPFERLIHWITERHKVHMKRFGIRGSGFQEPMWLDSSGVEFPFNTNGEIIDETDPPWTNDPILQTVFFCCPYRENDRVTAYLRDNFREEFKDDPSVFLGSIFLRQFNYIPTMRRLINAGIPQGMAKNPKRMIAEAANMLIPLRDQGEQMFSGAYIIKFWNGERKVEALLKTMEGLINDKKLLDQISGETVGTRINGCEAGKMSYAAQRLRAFRGMGPFYIYQFIGDLAYTHVFKNAPDWETWSESGPGTSRGLNRIKGIRTKPNGEPFERRINKPKDWQEELEALRTRVNKELLKRKMQPVHARDMTGCLCEYDKYERALYNERSIKRPYAGR